jgi:hypothetical protein
MNLRSVNVFRPLLRTYKPQTHAFHHTVGTLKPLMKRAKEEHLFFRSRHSGKIFTPKDLTDRINNGQYVWSPENWHLIDAQGRRVA